MVQSPQTVRTLTINGPNLCVLFSTFSSSLLVALLVHNILWQKYGDKMAFCFQFEESVVLTKILNLLYGLIYVSQFRIR